MTVHYNRTSDRAKRKALRNDAPAAERTLWRHLKGRTLAGVKFRRQHSVDAYVIDFYAPACKLAVEVDGDSHFSTDALRYDQERTAHLESFGIEVVRVTNVDVFENMEGVLAIIEAAVTRRQPPPNPLLSKEGEAV